MKERFKYNVEGRVNRSERLAKIDDLQKEYYPSRTEILLEEMCISFGTKLEQAYVNPINETKLVRLSKPIVVVNRYTGEKNLLAVQYTRFPPLHDFEEVVEIYKTYNPRSARKSPEKLEKEIVTKVKEKNNGEWNTFQEITDMDFFPDVRVRKWREEFYFSLFRLGEKMPKQEIKPFEIWDEGEFEGNLPDVHIIFSKEPLFVIYGTRDRIEGKEKSDVIHIGFPRVWAETGSAIKTTLSVHPVDKLGRLSNEEKFKQLYEPSGLGYEICMDSNLALGFIQTYLKNRCFGTTL